MKRFFCYILWMSIVLPVFGKGTVELRERIYVQTDKHLYLAGESVLMKLLTTDAEQIPLVFSKIAYAELVDDTIARIQVKVELTNGTGTGQMLLPVDLPTGYYRLIAYTQFMRNEGVEVFFEKNIAVMNTFQTDYLPAEVDTVSLSASSMEEDVGTVSLQPNSETYPTRTRGELIISDLPENMVTLSVSITGKGYIPAAETDVSLFRQNRTKPNGNTITRPIEFIPEYEGHIIRGKLIDNQKVDSETLTASESASNLPFGLRAGDFQYTSPCLSFPMVDGIRFFAGQKTESDEVRFYTSGVSGTKEIATVVYNAGEKYRVDILSPFVNRYMPKPMPTLHLDSIYYDRLLARSVALQASRYFSEDSPVNESVLKPYFKKKPDWSYLLDEYTRFTTMRDVFIEFIVGARFRRNAGKQEISVITRKGSYFDYGSMPLVLLDGVPVSDHDAIYNYDPLAVEQINIYTGPLFMGGYIFDGIVELITYRRLHADLQLDKSSQVIAYEGTQPPYRPDTPDYSNYKNRLSWMPDGRHTLLWNPDVQTNGKTSIRLPFDTSDLVGEFQATVEGVTEDGKFVFATSFFKVE